jgi:hypothetical protein
MVPAPGVEAAAAPEPRGVPAWPPWADTLLVAAAFLALALWTWGGWPDVIMDFGRELYVAWRVSEGDVLHRDVASFYGPLSPYVNAAWFELFGVGLRTLALANLAILAVVAATLWRIVRRGSAHGTWAPTAAALAFLAVCGFAQRVSSGSFNFVAPYSHEATHGFALAALAVLASLRLADTGRLRYAALAGTLAGLSFLTKPESFVAAAGASGTGLLLALRRPGLRPRPARAIAAYAGALVVPPLAAFGLLAAALGAERAATGVLGSWAHAGKEDLRANAYFAWSLGTNDVGGSLAAMGRAAGVQVAVLAAPAALAWVAGRRRRLVAPLAVVAAAALPLALLPARDPSSWLHVARPFPLWALAGAAAGAWALRAGARDEAAFNRYTARLVLGVFAFLMLLRILLHARLYHYGFVLAAPAVVLVVAALVDWIPEAIGHRGGAGAVFRAAALALVAFAVAVHLGSTREWLRAKRVVVGEGADRFRADVRGAYVNAGMQGLAALARPGDTLVALPEGVMVNYLLRMRSSMPYVTVLPSDLATFGEDELLGALERRPPDLILLVHRETAEYGPRFFGTDYGRRFATWIDAHYVRAGGVGDPPFRPGSTFGMVALRRRTPAAPPGGPPGPP